MNIESWWKQPLAERYPYVYGIYLKWNQGGEYENVPIPVAVGVTKGGYSEVV